MPRIKTSVSFIRIILLAGLLGTLALTAEAALTAPAIRARQINSTDTREEAYFDSSWATTNYYSYTTNWILGSESHATNTLG